MEPILVTSSKNQLRTRALRLALLAVALFAFNNFGRSDVVQEDAAKAEVAKAEAAKAEAAAAQAKDAVAKVKAAEAAAKDAAAKDAAAKAAAEKANPAPTQPPVADDKAGKPAAAETKPAETKPDETKSADAKPADAKPADPTPADAKAADSKKPADAKKPSAASKDDKPVVGEKDQLSFRQSKVAAEMSELEDRMFRLSEALKAMEPENSSRLMLGLKYAREELILHQMRQTQDVLDKLNLGDAVTEQKQLIAKLQRLQDLLLSSDLDMQMRLQRLRQIREILRRLDTGIKEEQRELNQSTELAEKEKQAEGLKKKRKTLEELIKRETEHLDEGQGLAKANPAEEKAVDKLGKGQEATGKDTKSLAEDKEQGEAEPKNLAEAAEKMAEAVASLAKKLPVEAVPPMQKALEALKKEQDELAKKQAALAAELAAEKFAAMRKDQMGNHKMTDGIAELTRQLGDSGASALSELIRAGGSMGNAEGKLGSQNAGEASDEQGQALASLKYAKEQLKEEAEKLLDELRAEVKKKVMEGLALMLEKQIAVRQSTAALSERVKEGSRQALTGVVALSKTEGLIIDSANELLTLVEETEFGIALPAALGVVRDQMENVKTLLAKGDASEPVVTAEKQIEADLTALMDAMKQLPSQKGDNKDKARKGSPQEQQRELNRIIAELKMIRLLQVRVNKDTLGVDARRPKDAALPGAVKKEIGELEGREEDIRDVTERLASERGDEVRQQ